MEVVLGRVVEHRLDLGVYRECSEWLEFALHSRQPLPNRLDCFDEIVRINAKFPFDEQVSARIPKQHEWISEVATRGARKPRPVYVLDGTLELVEIVAGDSARVEPDHLIGGPVVEAPHDLNRECVLLEHRWHEARHVFINGGRPRCDESWNIAAYSGPFHGLIKICRFAVFEPQLSEGRDAVSDEVEQKWCARVWVR